MGNPGRPPGTPNTKTTAVVELSRCPVCESTERTPYTNTTVLDYAGTTAAGEPHTHVVWRTTACKNCGQARRDKTLENRTATNE